MEKILCVDDSPEVFMFLKAVLNDYELIQASDLKSAIHTLKTNQNEIDLVLLDVSLPDGNGIKSLSDLKQIITNKVIPFVMLTNDDDILSKVAAFGLGADDYIQKPPNAAELKARVQARIRSAKVQQKESDTIKLGTLTINLDKIIVSIEKMNGKIEQIDLTPIEFKILKLLCSYPNQVFSRNQLIDSVWGIGKFITERTVDAHISHLRKKISESNVLVSTVLSTGYKVEFKS